MNNHIQKVNDYRTFATPKVPGFEAVFAILTIAAVAYLIRRREE
ncbi:MAG: PGF-CTERM sorting domain-containing protein [Methanocellales archaeon]|nr:PGF-CTERM sorting domain-containing protein [Methanocellales archaeon]